MKQDRRTTDVDTLDGRIVALQILAALTLLLAAAVWYPANAAQSDWDELKEMLYEDRAIADGADWLAIEAPYRAHDAALVPIKISALKPQDEGLYIKSITLIIDKNPAPVAAVFHMERESGVASISTRVRVNAYSDVRAIAETSDGALYMVSRFVKASGGCSAPSQKNLDESLAQMGRMKLRQYTPVPATGNASSPVYEAQLMIRHPNTSGLQVDQLTGYHIPAHFVDRIDIRQGDKTLLSVEGAISLSEDPTVRFHFVPSGDEVLSARVTDTEENVFEASWPVQAEPVTN